MSFLRYERYKDSGVEWLGDVPEHWDIYRSKVVFAERNVKATENDEQLTASQKYGVIPQKMFSELEDQKVMQVILGREILKKAEVNDFVISMRSFQGGLEFCPYSGAISSAYVPLYPRKKIENSFFKHLFKAKPFIAALQQTSNLVRDGQALRYSNFTQLSLPFPGLAEQTQIACFLDRETSRIDTLIEEQKRLIALLKEKRQAVISHAVTKGLDSSVPMKDSGVEGLGEVPEHWNLVPMKHLAVLNPRKSDYQGDQNLSCSFVPMEKLKTGVLVLDEERIILDVYMGYTYFENGDVLQAKVTPCFENKNIAVADGLTNGIGFGSSEINVLRALESISNWFLYYRLQENNFMGFCISSMIGVAGLKRVPSDTINNFSIALPPISEQTQIACFLDSETCRIDTLIEEQKRLIALLQERRSALISAAVTGKIDLRTWKP